MLPAIVVSGRAVELKLARLGSECAPGFVVLSPTTSLPCLLATALISCGLKVVSKNVLCAA